MMYMYIYILTVLTLPPILRGELRLRLNSRWNLGLEVTFSVVGKCNIVGM